MSDNRRFVMLLLSLIVTNKKREALHSLHLLRRDFFEGQLMKYAMSKMVATACLLLSMTAHAGFDEGLAAANKNDFATALKEWAPLASQGNADAQFNLGLMYANGHGVPQDFREAAKWYRLAADQGVDAAQQNLGSAYLFGKGVAQDYKEAAKWLRLAAEQGIASSQYNLGVMYRDGRGVLQDYQEAIKWFLLAADQGDVSAQHNLGTMYVNGRGVHQDKVLAYAFFNISATNAPSADKMNEDVENREKLSSSMTAKEIAAGQSLSREISQPGMLLKALDKYSKKQAIKEKAMQ